MKNTRKFLAIFMVIAMIMSMGVLNAFAEPNNNEHTITIDNKATGYAYEAYRVFEGDFVEGELTNIAWSDGVDSVGLMEDLKSIEAFKDCSSAVDVAKVLGTINAKNDATALAFADAVAANLGAPAGSIDDTKADDIVNDGYVMSVTGDGYYIVINTKVPEEDESADPAYSRYILEVVKDVVVSHKAEVPEVEKNIVEDGEEVGHADKNIGDKVEFKLTATLPSNYNLYKTYTLTFHDTMSKGLDFNNDVKVMIGNNVITDTLYAVDTTKHDHDDSTDDDTNIDIIISDVKALDEYGAGNSVEIVVTYTATLNGDATIGNPGNDNKVYLEYTNNPNPDQDGTPDTGDTPEDKVVVFTYELDITKVDGGDKNIKLDGAEFVFYRLTDDSDPDSKEYVMIDSEGKVCGWTSEVTEATTLTSANGGLFGISGLDEGTYYLEETKAPTGYNLPENPFEVEITATTTDTEITDLSGKIAGEDLKLGTDTTKGDLDGTIVNNSGTTLPSTGSIGTAIFYVAGGIMVVAAVIFLVTKKRMKNAEN